MLKLYGPVLILLCILVVVVFAGGADKGVALIGSAAKWVFGMALIAGIIYMINVESKNTR